MSGPGVAYTYGTPICDLAAAMAVRARSACLFVSMRRMCMSRSIRARCSWIWYMRSAVGLASVPGGPIGAA